MQDEIFLLVLSHVLSHLLSPDGVVIADVIIAHKDQPAEKGLIALRDANAHDDRRKCETCPKIPKIKHVTMKQNMRAK